MHATNKLEQALEGTKQAVESITELPPQRRLGWLMYIFEGLDNSLPEDEFATLLDSSIKDLQVRRNLGSW